MATSPLVQMFDAYLKMDPRVAGNSVALIGDDVDVDLWEEDSYLAGLVTRVISGRLLDVAEIRLDPTIDRRLAELLKEARPSLRQSVDAYVNYRKAMRELAGELSRVTGIELTS